MTEDNVIRLQTTTTLDLPAETILDGAREADLETAAVLGWEQNGDFYFASTIADPTKLLWLLKTAERALFNMAEDNEGTP